MMERNLFSLLPCQSLIGKNFALVALESSASSIKAYKALYFLFVSFLQGHQYVEASANHIYPALYEVLDEKELLNFDEKEIIDGFFSLTDQIVQKNTDLICYKPVVREDDKFYLQKNYLLEKKISQKILDLYLFSAKTFFNEEQIEAEIKNYESFLSSEQRLGIKALLLSTFHLLTGGPGTGKSYTVFYLLKVYFALCAKASYKPKVLIAAPTGKAASALKNKMKDLTSIDTIHVLTLHKALKIGKDKNQGHDHLFLYDLVIIDESSMVDIHLFYLLFTAISKGARILLMGDHNQLPPVESGMIFGELTRALPATFLTLCKRVENPSLLVLAQKILLSDELFFSELIKGKNLLEGVVIHEIQEDFDFMKIIEAEPKLDLARSIILTPMKIGSLGSIQINKSIHSFYQQVMDKSTPVPILITKTQYELGIFNGDIGFLDPKSQQVLFDDEEGEKHIPLALIDQYQMAFAMTVHKSQGSEYDHVTLLLPKGSEKFGKELLYTAVTRAKKTLTIYSQQQTLIRCISKKGKRSSSLAQRLAKDLNKKS